MLELCCLLILSLHLAIGCKRSRRPGRFLLRVAVLALGSWLAEDSCLHLYGFYAYNRDAWTVFVDRMPLMVALIWPGVILSSWEYSRLLFGRRVPLFTAAMVLADASFIEPVAVRAGLWQWFEPGFFGVPPIGVLGWAFFAGLSVALFARIDARQRPWTWDLLVLVVAPLVTHVLLIATWWGAARWLSAPIPSGLVVGLVWLIAAALVALAVATGARQRIPLGAYISRLPAAGFFFVLLTLYWAGDPLLVAYALAFVPPYVAIGSWKW